MALNPKMRVGILATLCGGMIIALVSLYLVQRTAQKTLDELATDTAHHWATYLAQTLPDLNNIVSGNAPSASTLAMLESSQAVGDIFSYKIFNAQGTLVLMSDYLNYGVESDANIAAHNIRAAQVLATGAPFIEVQQGDGETRPLYYSEAYVRLEVENQPIGIIEVYIDQTHLRASLFTSFHELTLLMFLTMAISFGIPALGFIWRTREQENTQNRLDHASHHDGLTGTRNRNRFNIEVDQMIADDHAVTIYALDFDHFKTINETHGHVIGDDVLRQAGERLATLLGDTGITGRPSGDEFAICQLRSLRPTNSCANFAMMIHQTLAEPFHINDLSIECSCSIGYAASPQHGNTAADLVQRSSVALDRAKLDGRDRAVRYDDAIEALRRERLNLENLLRQSVQDERFTLNYQPQFDTQSARLVGFEALVRLNDYNGKPIGPDKFVPVVEAMGLINHLGEWVLRKACGFAALWSDDVMVAVNLSAIQFEDGRLVDTVKDVLQETGLPANQLELEITESLLIDDTDNVIKQLHELRALGIKIALDDFGTGYSSLSYLWKFQFDRLKIDRSFVMQIEHANGKAYDILYSIVSLAHSLKLDVTAEGVETLQQLNVLKTLGASHVQGFLLGRPIPETEVPALILSKAKPLVRAADPVEIANRVSLFS